MSTDIEDSHYAEPADDVADDSKAVRDIIAALMAAPLPFFNRDACRYCGHPTQDNFAHHENCWWQQRSMAGAGIPIALALLDRLDGVERERDALRKALGDVARWHDQCVAPNFCPVCASAQRLLLPERSSEGAK